MKKIILLLLLLPCIGFAQVATWNSFSPVAAANTTATNLSASGMTAEMNQWEAAGIFLKDFHTTQSSTNLNEAKYLEFKVTPNTGYKITPSQFSFTYYSPGDGGAKKAQIKASVNNGAFSSLTNASGQSVINLSLDSQQTLTVNFPANFAATPNQPITVRVYLYDLTNNYYTKMFIRTNAYGSGIAGPAIAGTVATYSATLTAFNDSYDNNINTAVNYNVLANDVNYAANSTVTIDTAPAHGTVTVNTDKTIKYTPNNNFIGTDIFKYKINNPGGQSTTATVTVNVKGITPTGPLNGTYFIGTNGHFTTITAAVNYLNASANGGVSGPVTFLLKNALYNNASGETFPLTINQFANTSPTNTVTFKPAPTVNVTIAASEVNNYTGVPAVFKLNGADNIIFDGSNLPNNTTRNLTIVNACAITYLQRSVIWITQADNSSINGATNILVKNTNIRQTTKNQDGMFCMGIYSGANTYVLDGSGQPTTSIAVNPSTANNSNLTVTNNDFMNVKEGVIVNGGNTATTNVIITQNDLGAENNTETIILPVHLNNVNTFTYSENLVYNLYRNSTGGGLVSAGIYVTGSSRNGVITRNNMKDLVKTTTESYTFGGIVVELASSNTASNILIANNFILNVSAQGNGGSYLNGHGIAIGSGGGIKVYHNTVSLNTNQPNGGYSAALYVNTGVTNLDVRNNIFANNQTNANTRRTAISVKATVANVNSVFTSLDYNDLFSTDKTGFIAPNQENLGNIDDFNSPYYITTLNAWKSTTGKDANSIDVQPSFVSAGDLHLSASANGNLNNKGTVIAAVTKDIDGQVRSTTTPDMGADEFGGTTTPPAGNNTGIYCDSSTTWNGTQWSNGTPTAEKDAIFTGNFTQTGGEFNACSMFVQGTAQVNFINNSNAVIVHTVNVETTAALTFESSSNLVQVNNTINVGTVTVKRNSSKLKRLDYTIWSSPVTGNQTMKEFSPATAANRFYEYSTPNNYYLALTDINTATFKNAKGYLIRMPNSLPLEGYNDRVTATVFEGIFRGTPNNGTISIPLEYTSDSRAYNGVGNPYPSPISVTDFIDANIDNIEGTLWLWRKTNDATKTSYSVCTKLGYAANAAPGGVNDLVADPFQMIDGITTPVLNTGQGFVVKAKGAGKQLTFRNNMRKKVNYNNFFRNGGSDNPQQNFMTASRIWLNVVNSNDVFSQTVIGYLPQATSGYDNGIDGKSFVDGDVNVYSVIDDLNLAIQGRPEFTVSDEVKLGFKSDVAGSFNFVIDHVDGLFAQGQDIFIKDNVTGAMHNLNNGSYTFQSEAGTFNDRFVVVYAQEPVMATNDNVLSDKDVVVYRSGSQVGIRAPQAIKSVSVYDITGRMVYTANTINALQYTTTGLNTQQQVLIVKAQMDNNQVIAKKFMMK